MIAVYLVRVAYIRCLKSSIYILNKLRFLKYNLWVRLYCVK
nr:MAG TPA_asm: DNA-binding protein [Bacteriophage sp.]